jgi:hypothetical protein
MEETGITIHNGLPRRNNFLRENPMLCGFAIFARGLARFDPIKCSEIYDLSRAINTMKAR